jgi:hypothetical protein
MRIELTEDLQALADLADLFVLCSSLRIGHAEKAGRRDARGCLASAYRS